MREPSGESRRRGTPLPWQTKKPYGRVNKMEVKLL